MNKIYNRFDMRDYVNTSDLSSTNSQIAKFCLDHPDLIHTCSLNKLSEASYFSQPTLSRFFNNVCNLSFIDYVKSDVKGKQEVKNSILSYFTLSNIDQIKKLQNMVGLEDKEIYKIVNNLYQSQRLLIIGPTFFQGYSHSLGTALLYYDKTIYSPYSYEAQSLLIKEMNNQDIVVIHSLSKEWENTDLMHHYEKILSHSSSIKYSICLKETIPEYRFPFHSIILENGSEALRDVQLLSFYKVLMFNFLKIESLV